MHTVNKALKYVLITLLTINLVLFGYILFGQVDVIQDDSWTISVDKTSYVEGDTIAATSEYTKLRQVSGESKRYLDCLNANGGEVRYPLNGAVADRVAGKNATGINLTVPEVKEAPTKCHVTIVLRYEIFRPFRYHTEQKKSADFEILLRNDEVSTTPPVSINPNSDTPQRSSNSNNTPNQTTNNTTNNTTNTTNNNPAPETPEPEQERGILTQVLDLLNPTR